MSAVLPQQVFPPLFNRYDSSMTFGSHIDNAIRTHPERPIRIRTDVSATLFTPRPRIMTAVNWWSRTPTAAMPQSCRRAT